MAVKLGTTVENAGKLVNATSNITVEEVSQTDIDEVKMHLRIRLKDLSTIPNTHTIHYVKDLDEYATVCTFFE